MKRNSKKITSSQRGNSLIEVAIAATALVFVMVAIVSGMMLAVRNSSHANNQALATKYTQEGIELFRRMYNELGWESFHSVIDDNGSNIYCLDDLSQIIDHEDFDDINTGACGENEIITGTPFTRQATVNVGTNEITFIVTVTWPDGDKNPSTRIEQTFRRRQL